VLPAYSQSSSEGAIKQAGENFEEQSKKNSPKKSYLPPSMEGSPFANSSDDSVDEPSSHDPQSLQIKINSVVFKGATVFSEREFGHCSEGIIGQTVGESELVQLSDCVTQHYVLAGYSLSRAVIPEQDVNGGRLVVKVIEGYISNVKFAGGDAEKSGVSRFAAPLLEQRPITQTHLERHLFLISDLPGVSLKDTALEEIGEMSGAFELTITIKTWQLWSSSELDNRGSDAIGPYQSYQNVSLNSLLGLGETIEFSYSSIVDSTDELNFGLVSLDLPLNVHGMRLTAFLSGSVSEPDDFSKIFNTRYKSLEGGVNLDWNLIRKREHSLWVGAGVWAKNNQEQNDFGTYIDDTLHGLSFYLRFNKNDQWGGENFFYANLRQGLDLGNVSRKGDVGLSRFDGDGEFTKLYFDYSRNQIINQNWSLFFTGALQLSSHGLLSSQEFYFGGSRFGRAYESGVVSGDGGAAASLELRYSRDLDFGLLNGVQLYGFADVGTVWDRGNDFIDDAVLSSAGFGARLYFDYGIEADIAAAFPIDDADLTEAKDAEFFFRLSRSYKLSELRFDQPLSMLREAYKK
jgi:hemolysin activation/secretion protein